ncbi:MAG: hypothetical protein RLZZ292_551 [Bacteroidota bacterium]|jgi:hypothetical protein
MIKNIITKQNTHFLFRPQFAEKKYLSIVEFNEEQLLGKGGQNPINAGSSMFKDTPNLAPQLQELIEKHFSKNTYINLYINDNQVFAVLNAKNLIRFKKDKTFRNEVLNTIFDKETRTFKTRIYEGYLFVFIALHFSLNSTLFSKSSTPNTKQIAANYFKDEKELLDKVIDTLYQADNIENLNGLCHGRYFFLDDKLSDYNDFKPVPLEIVRFIKPKRMFKPQNKILYGCPGTGKSTKLNETYRGQKYTTTFHPESDYSSFVGCYKPVTDVDRKITYQFVPQVFMKAYVAAWKNLDAPCALIIEEINRGNCAAIFGDIFQLLDRDNNGFSRYFIHADSDIAAYLRVALADTDYAQRVQDLYLEKEQYECSDPYELLLLPNNLSLFATMNTSDQSLFPMDSAFKRRWDWEYVPIDYVKASEFTIVIDEETNYNWGTFIKIVNANIKEVTQSEDKQLGTFFVVPNDQGVISKEQFCSKVLFYLWSEVYRDEQDGIFMYLDAKNQPQLFSFNALFEAGGTDILKKFMDFNNVTNITNTTNTSE